MNNRAAEKDEPSVKFDMLEEMFRQRDAEAEKKPKQFKFSLPTRKKGKHELQNR